MFSGGRCHCEKFSHEIMDCAKNVLYFIHANLVGTILKDSLHKSKYFLVFTNEYCWKNWVYFLCAKNETFVKFKIFKELMEGETREKIY
jgi:hypothetical protein